MNVETYIKSSTSKLHGSVLPAVVPASQKTMADRQVVWAKKQNQPPPGKRQGGHQKVRQAQASDPPQPKPKPKPKRNAAPVAQSNLAEERSESEYAELKAVRRESVNHYAPLCAATRNNPQGAGSTSSTLPSVAEKGGVPAANDSTTDLDVHYSNVHVRGKARRASNSYENCKFSEEKEDVNKLKNFCLFHWKTIVTVGVTMSVMLAALVVVLGIATAGLSGSSRNGERYQKLRETAVDMAGQIERLDRQLDASNAALLQLKSESDALNRKIAATGSQLSVQRGYFNTRIHENEEKIASLRRQQDTSVVSNVSKLEGEIQALNYSLLNRIEIGERDVTELRRNVTMLTSSVNTLVEVTVRELLASIADINGSVAELTGLPVSCASSVHESVAENSPEATSPQILINQVSHCSSIKEL